jgi:hypothetical protein
MNWLTAKRWSPYLTGVLIGVLCWIAFYVSNKPIGVSTAFVRSVAMIEEKAVPDHYKATGYLTGYGTAIDWEWMLVIGIFAGALFSSLISRDVKAEVVPGVWKETVGTNAGLRLLFAFLGGIILMFGARMAGGCTSGHGLSGGLQLSVGSWTFMGAFFALGIVASLLLYRAKKPAAQPPQQDTPPMKPEA